MKTKPTSPSRDIGHLYPARLCNAVNGIEAHPFCIDDLDDFGDGIKKLQNHRIPSIAEDKGPIAPAYYPSSREEMMRNLEAKWDRIDKRIAERERNPSPPPFGYAINQILAPQHLTPYEKASQARAAYLALSVFRTNKTSKK